jgi:hypothetical protein
MTYRGKLTPFALLIVAIIGMQSLLPAQTTRGVNKPERGSVVPFVGCKSDGQLGPEREPKGKSKILPMVTEKAQQLAYYQGKRGVGVLAPRGWFCFGTYGSNGTNLFVSPQPMDAKTLFSTSWKGFFGAVIQVSVEYGGTSGRFGVAQAIARVFPDHKAFVRQVIAEGINPASDFPFGPYPNDKLVYKNKEMVEYETPANTDGLGTASRLQKNANPIRGAAILVEPDTDLLSLSVRLPHEMDDLTPVIIQQVELEAAAVNP